MRRIPWLWIRHPYRWYVCTKHSNKVNKPITLPSGVTYDYGINMSPGQVYTIKYGSSRKPIKGITSRRGVPGVVSILRDGAAVIQQTDRTVKVKEPKGLEKRTAPRNWVIL